MGTTRKSHHIVDDQEIKRFNLRRENENGKTYSLPEFKELLHKMGYSSNGNLIKCMVSGENPPFIRLERGKYGFNPKPIYIQRLQKVWDEYAYIGRNRMAQNPDQKQLELDVSRAIKLLKDLGYKVLRPITKFEEC